MSGMRVGEILGFSLSGALASTHIPAAGVDIGGWSSVFYVFGCAGVLWFPLWASFAYESPSVHPFISLEERKLLREGRKYLY